MRISWEAAYNIIIEKIKEAQNDFGLTSVGCYIGGGANYANQTNKGQFSFSFAVFSNVNKATYSCNKTVTFLG